MHTPQKMPLITPPPQKKIKCPRVQKEFTYRFHYGLLGRFFLKKSKIGGGALFAPPPLMELGLSKCKFLSLSLYLSVCLSLILSLSLSFIIYVFNLEVLYKLYAGLRKINLYVTNCIEVHLYCVRK